MSKVTAAHNGALDILRQVIKERKEAVEKDPDLIVSDMLTQSGIYYEARPRYIAAGIDMSKVGTEFRKNQVRKIEQVCEELEVTREEIGIFAQARTFLYFAGQKYSVGYKNVQELMHKGTDLILIEKEGMAEVLRPFAEKYGIAILNSIGFVARYAEDLAKLSEDTGSNIAMVTDYDVSGISMTRSLPFIYRIGIDFDTVKDLGLTNAEVEETYSTAKTLHYKGLLNMGPADYEDQETFDENMKYLKTKRIEIDNVIRTLNRKYGKGANRRFWEYIVKKLVERFPTRDYNRSIEVPEYVYPDVLHKLATALRQRITKLLEDDVKAEKDELAETKGVIKDIHKKEQKINDYFENVVITDTNLQPILEKIQDITDELNQE